MSVVVLLIAAGGVVAAGFLAAFAWAVRSGQYDDTCTPAVRMLLEDGKTGKKDGKTGRKEDGREPVSRLPVFSSSRLRNKDGIHVDARH